MYGPLLGIATNAFIPLTIAINLNSKHPIDSPHYEGEWLANSYIKII